MVDLWDVDVAGFRNFMRIDPVMLQELLQCLSDWIRKQDTSYWTLEPGLKLVSTLCHLATGDNYHSVMYRFPVASNTISLIVRVRCTTITMSLLQKYWMLTRMDHCLMHRFPISVNWKKWSKTEWLGFLQKIHFLKTTGWWPTLFLVTMHLLWKPGWWSLFPSITWPTSKGSSTTGCLAAAELWRMFLAYLQIISSVCWVL